MAGAGRRGWRGMAGGGGRLLLRAVSRSDRGPRRSRVESKATLGDLWALPPPRPRRGARGGAGGRAGGGRPPGAGAPRPAAASPVARAGRGVEGTDRMADANGRVDVDFVGGSGPPRPASSLLAVTPGARSGAGGAGLVGAPRLAARRDFCCFCFVPAGGFRDIFCFVAPGPPAALLAGGRGGGTASGAEGEGDVRACRAVASSAGGGAHGRPCPGTESLDRSGSLDFQVRRRCSARAARGAQPGGPGRVGTGV